jgi:hypothetical protein
MTTDPQYIFGKQKFFNFWGYEHNINSCMGHPHSHSEYGGKEKKNTCLARNWTQIIQPIHSHFTDWATMAHLDGKTWNCELTKLYEWSVWKYGRKNPILCIQYCADKMPFSGMPQNDQLNNVQFTIIINGGRHVTQRDTENIPCSIPCAEYSYTAGDTVWCGPLHSVLMIELTFPSNNHVTSGGGSPVILISSVSVRPTLTIRFCKLVRSICGFTAKKTVI